mmetsp:Transcript_22858/g.53335  ORF Transcript_22858/g.53335 Transcript_22858/m.53335 type:complete len:122 (-) Transcript_22858:447-812(-)
MDRLNPAGVARFNQLTVAHPDKLLPQRAPVSTNQPKPVGGAGHTHCPRDPAGLLEGTQTPSAREPRTEEAQQNASSLQRSAASALGKHRLALQSEVVTAKRRALLRQKGSQLAHELGLVVR